MDILKESRSALIMLAVKLDILITFKFFYAFMWDEDITSLDIIIVSPSVRKNLVTTVSVEGGSGLVNTGNRNVPGGETFYDGTLPKHTFQ